MERRREETSLNGFVEIQKRLKLEILYLLIDVPIFPITGKRTKERKVC